MILTNNSSTYKKAAQLHDIIIMQNRFIIFIYNLHLRSEYREKKRAENLTPHCQYAFNSITRFCMSKRWEKNISIPACTMDQRS